MDLKEEQALGGAPERHWYYAAKASMMADHVGRCREVLDVGAGMGFFSRWMLRKGLAARAVCVDPGYSREHEEEEAGRPIAFRQSITESNADLVLMMDVLEHVDDDVGLLREYLDLAPGARVLITVPAFEAIWSAHDDFLEHRRRYTLASLRQTVAKAGAREIIGHYYFGAIFPIAATVRMMQRGRAADYSDMRSANPVVNTVLGAVCGLERSVMRMNRVAGLSVVMVCQRSGREDNEPAEDEEQHRIDDNRRHLRHHGPDLRNQQGKGCEVHPIGQSERYEEPNQPCANSISRPERPGAVERETHCEADDIAANVGGEWTKPRHLLKQQDSAKSYSRVHEADAPVSNRLGEKCLLGHAAIWHASGCR